MLYWKEWHDSNVKMVVVIIMTMLMSQWNDQSNVDNNDCVDEKDDFDKN